MIAFGVLGYLMRKFGYEPAPLVLAFVLGPMMENNLRKALILSDGSFSIFVERPISLDLPRLCARDPALAAAAAPARTPRGDRDGVGGLTCSPDERSDIRELKSTANFAPACRCAHAGYDLTPPPLASPASMKPPDCRRHSAA